MITRVARGILALAAALVVATQPLAATAVEVAARPAVDETPGFEVDSEVITKVQKSLAGFGLYDGPVDGRWNRDLERAVRQFQGWVGLPVDGRIGAELIEKIKNRTQINGLLRRLDDTRHSDRESARKALLSRVETRDLVGDGQIRAAPTRDSAPCFREPSARCLLAEAAESAKAIHRDELRDWAFGEILTAQARAGLADDAIVTVRFIRDPRLTMVALRDIARGQAVAGNADEAPEAVAIIPDLEKQVEALADIATIQAKRNIDPRDTIDRLLIVLGSIDDPLKQVAYRARAAVIAARAGDSETARTLINAAERRARRTGEGGGLRYVAGALAEMEKPVKALEVLEDVPDQSDRVPILVKAAAAQARSGDAERALKTADGIAEERYRAIVLGRIATAQSAAGDCDAALGTVNQALAATDAIRFPYARAYAVSRLAYAAAEICPPSDGADGVPRPMDVAGRIEDDRLRAEVQWEIAARRRRAGDNAGAAEIEALAEESTKAIRSDLSRVWLFGEIAEGHADVGEFMEARTAFERGLAIAAAIDNPWGRARAVARMATTLVVLTDTAESASR